MMFIESAEGLVYTEPPTPWRLRLFFFLFGGLAFVIPYPFVRHGDWASITASTLMAGAAVVAPPLLGLLFIAIGMAKPQQVSFDRRRRAILRSGRRPWGSRETLSFDRVERVEVVRQPHRETPEDLFEVVLTIRGRRPIKLGAYDRRDAAAHWAGRVQATIGA